MRTELNEFLKSRKRVYKWEVGHTVRLLRSRKKFEPALKLIETMAKRGMNPTVSDHAIQLDLVAKTRGIAAAEEYFTNLPEPAKAHTTYGALLNCYCKELMTEKAEALLEKMEEWKFAPSAMAYNSLMTLYSKTNQSERIPGIVQKMKANGIMPNCFTYNVWMRALAVAGDIYGVERVIEEMKRDGRVTEDWTLYSNLASIFVDAGMFEKAESALKELEKRNDKHSLEAYQFLITLYGRTGNLLEVHRLWRSLKLAFRNMANISYLNMIQVLVNLKDLSGAESCFKEWESRCSTYDVRIVNAMIRGYCKEGRIDDAKALEERLKKQGVKPNAKSWEIFMDYYFKEKNMEEVILCVERAVCIKGKGNQWKPPKEAVLALMSHFENKKDVKGAEKLMNLLKIAGEPPQLSLFESLVRVYAAAGSKCLGIKQRLKMENVEISEETEKILDRISSDE